MKRHLKACEVKHAFASDSMQTRPSGRRTPVAQTMVMRACVRWLTAGLLGACFVQSAQAVAGDPDISFGSGGRVFTDFGALNDEAHALLRHPVGALAGRIVAAGCANGSSAGGTPKDFGLARYTAEGALDNSFGSNGRVVTDIWAEGRNDCANAAVLLPDDRIVVAGCGDRWRCRPIHSTSRQNEPKSSPTGKPARRALSQ
jgi:Domain of unknown function (DUF5122) beta-propeller